MIKRIRGIALVIMVEGGKMIVLNKLRQNAEFSPSSINGMRLSIVFQGGHSPRGAVGSMDFPDNPDKPHCSFRNTHLTGFPILFYSRFRITVSFYKRLETLC